MLPFIRTDTIKEFLTACVPRKRLRSLVVSRQSSMAELYDTIVITAELSNSKVKRFSIPADSVEAIKLRIVEIVQECLPKTPRKASRPPQRFGPARIKAV